MHDRPLVVAKQHFACNSLIAWHQNPPLQYCIPPIHRTQCSSSGLTACPSLSRSSASISHCPRHPSIHPHRFIAKRRNQYTSASDLTSKLELYVDSCARPTAPLDSSNAKEYFAHPAFITQQNRPHCSQILRVPPTSSIAHLHELLSSVRPCLPLSRTSGLAMATTREK